MDEAEGAPATDDEEEALEPHGCAGDGFGDDVTHRAKAHVKIELQAKFARREGSGKLGGRGREYATAHGKRERGSERPRSRSSGLGRSGDVWLRCGALEWRNERTYERTLFQGSAKKPIISTLTSAAVCELRPWDARTSISISIGSFSFGSQPSANPFISTSKPYIVVNRISNTVWWWGTCVGVWVLR